MAQIKVIAKTFGQRPDGIWVRDGEEFMIDADLASHKWMVRADGQPWPARKADKSTKVKAGDESKSATSAVEELRQMAITSAVRAEKAEADAAKAIAAANAETEELRKQVEELKAAKKA